MKSWWAKAALALGTLLVLAAAGIQGSIEWSVRSFSRSAMKQFPGSAESALIDLAACETCPMQDRNHAVWALGQLREKRALPVLAKYRTGERCDHARRICQYELEKALKRIAD
jgi:hypothetical protein